MKKLSSKSWTLNALGVLTGKPFENSGIHLNHLLIGFFYFFILVSCDKNDKREKSEITISNENLLASEVLQDYKYTIIFEKRETADNSDYPGAITPSDVSHLYYVEEFELTHVLPEDNESVDTIEIKVPTANLLVDLTYFQMDKFSYPLKAGDTMVVKYVKGIPQVKLINRSYPRYDFAYDSLRMNYLNHNKIDMNEMIMTKDINQNYQSFLSSRKSLYEKESRLLDSLHKNGLVSDSYNDILKEKIRYKFLNLTTSFGLTKNVDNLSFFYNKADLNKAGLLDFSFYRLFLLQYVYNILNDGQGFSSKNGFTQDSRKAFDSIVIDPNIENEKVRDLLLKNTLIEIRKNFSEEDGEIYYKKFLNEVADTSLIQKFNEKFLLNLRNDNNVQEVLLLGANQNPISLDSLLIKNRNKVVYIDFWASWCVPCIKEMPASKKLQNDYKEKDIEFIYISIDHDSQKWERSYNNLNLGVGENNLITLNYPGGQFYKDMSLKSIPRYFLFDKNGNIVHKNAPAPSTAEIRILLNQLLKEENTADHGG